MTVTRHGGWRERRFLVLFVALLLVVAACGGDDPEAAETTAETEAPETTDAPETTAAPETTEATESTDAPATTMEGGESCEPELGVINTPESNPPPAELVEAAEAEGEVVWYTGSSVFELIEAAFEDVYDINVIPNRQNSGAVTALYMQEAEAGAVAADVLQAFNPPMFDEAGAAGHFAPLSVEEIPNLADIPSELIAEYSVPSNSWVWGWVYNTDLLEEAPGPNWEDLADPAYEGEIIMQDPRTGGLTAATMYWFYTEYGEQFLRDMGELDLRWIDSNVAALDPLAAGEASLVIPTNSNNPDPLIEEGAPLQFLFPEDNVSSWFSHGLAISAEAPHPNAARLFANFLMSVEVQEGTSFAGPPIHPDACSDLVLADTLHQLTFEDVQNGEAMLDEFVEWLQIDQ